MPDDCFNLIFGRMRIIVRRHIADVDPSDDLCPEMAAGSGSKITRLVVDPQVTFNLFRPVTPHAILLQKRLIGMRIRTREKHTSEQRPPGRHRNLSIHVQVIILPMLT